MGRVFRSAALFAVTFASVFGAACERPGCEDATLCVELCFTPIFRQCSGCPAGSFPEALCDRRSVCTRELERPDGTCDPTSCTEGENGRCVLAGGSELCTYDDCQDDGHCTVSGDLCACGAGLLEANVCAPASCARPEDCGDYPCSPVPGCGGPNDPVNGGPVALACHREGDECFVDRQCEEGQFCAPNTDGRWVCVAPSC